MKNLKVGTKITASFGIVIALFIIVAIVVCSTNLSSINNVEEISHNSYLQTLGNKTRADFLNASIPANMMLLSPSQAYYENFQEHDANVINEFNQMYTYMNNSHTLEKLIGDIQNAENNYKIWSSYVSELGEINKKFLELEAELTSAAAELSDVSFFIVDEQLEQLKIEINENTDPSGLLRRTNRTDEAHLILQNITDFRTQTRVFSLTLDEQLLPQILDLVDKTLDLTTDYRDESTRSIQRDEAQKIIDAINHYREILVDYGNLCIRNTELDTLMPKQSEIALQAVVSAMNALDSEMNIQIANTQKSATTALTTVVSISAVSFAVAIVMTAILVRGITQPIDKMKKMINIVGHTGRLKFTDSELDEVESAISKDEIGESISDFSKMMNRLISVTSELERVSNGDLTVELHPLSSEDTISNAISIMINNLNEMFVNINETTTQVSAGSTQISEGSQSLAQGATEQAATIQQLAGSVAELADKTHSNAEMASKAADLSEIIRQNAQKGNSQMDSMTSAVREINDASHAIKKVIKVIDDIAFQTNILALNAAVEAARAGQYGKGFAVVAEEVRNLAAKSSEAAKDTEDLIANSMQKAELGAQIAEKTASSFGEIVSGISESTAIVTEIARSSEEQSVGIKQLNTGIDQVASVVQQNSATAQQSAAASAQMNNQAITLTDLVSHFKLKTT